MSQRKFDTDTAMDEPATGFVGFNNAAFASVTAIALHQSDSRTGNADETAWLNLFDDSGSDTLGLLTFRSNTSDEDYVRFKVTGLTDNTDWYQLAVTYVEHNGSFDASEVLDMGFDFFGEKGDDGADGAVCAFKFAYSSTKTDGDPGAGIFRDNNGTFGSISELYIDVEDANGVGVEVMLEAMIGAVNNNRVYAQLHQFSTDFTDYRVYNVLGITSATGYRKLTVSPVDSSGSFANEDECYLYFAPVKTPAIPGFSYKVDLASQTDADPGSGILRPNNSTWASVTEIYADNNNFEGTNISASLDELCSVDNETTLADLFIYKEGDLAKFEHYRVTAIEDSTGYRTLTVTHVDGSENIVNGDVVSAMLIPHGLDSYQMGYHLRLDLGAQTDGDPGAGYFRLNNATPASATEAYVNDADRLGGNITTWLENLGASNNGTRRGRLRIEERSEPGNYAEYWITAATVDGSGYWKVSLAYISGGGTLSDDDYIVVNDWRAGDAGVFHGYEYDLDLASTAISDPGAGEVRFNNADLTLATTMIIDALASTGADTSGFIEFMDDADNATTRGTVRVAKKTDPDETHVMYSVTGAVTNSSGYYQVPIAYISGDGTLADNDDVIITFISAGDGFGAGSTKTDPVLADTVLARDSENSDAPVEIPLTNLRDLIAGEASSGFGNRLINPLFRVDIEGNASVGATNDDHVVEGWRFKNNTDCSPYVTRVTGDSVSYALQCSTDADADAAIAAGQYTYWQTAIEGYDFADALWGTADAKNVILKVRIRAPTTGTYCIAVQNSAQNRSYVFEVSCTANTWVDVEETIPGDTSGTWLKTNGIGLRVFCAIAAGSTYQTTADTWAAGNYFATANQANGVGSVDNIYRIEDPILSVGYSIPTEVIPDSVEYARCNRYAELVGAGASGFYHTATDVQLGLPYKVPKRTSSPTITITDTAPTVYRSGGTDAGTSSTIQASNGDEFGGRVRIDGFSGLTSSEPCILQKYAFLVTDRLI